MGYSPLDRYIIDAAERKMRDAHKQQFYKPPHTELFFRDTVKDIEVRMSKQIQEVEDRAIMAQIIEWMDAQPWYRKLWWRVRRFFYPMWLEKKVDRERQRLEEEDEREDW